MLFSEDVDGGGGIVALNTSTGKSELIWKGPETLHEDGNYPNFALAKDGLTSAAIRSTWAEAPDVWAGKIGDWKRVTKTNEAQNPIGKSRERYLAERREPVQGWLVYPRTSMPRKISMIVEIHGGPASMRSAGWPSSHFDLSVMAGLGYFVFSRTSWELWGRGGVYPS